MDVTPGRNTSPAPYVFALSETLITTPEVCATMEAAVQVVPGKERAPPRPFVWEKFTLFSAKDFSSGI